MNKSEILNEIEELKFKITQLEEMAKRQDEPKFKRKACGEMYYLIRIDSVGVGVSNWNEDSSNTDAMYFENNNYFYTSERATEVADKIKFLLMLERLHDTYCPDYKPDWENEDETKFSICFSQYDNEYCYSCAYNFKGMPMVYFPTKKIAQKVCDILNEELANKR